MWNTTAKMSHLNVNEMRLDGIEKYDFFESEPSLSFTNEKWEMKEENESTQLKGYAKKR